MSTSAIESASRLLVALCAAGLVSVLGCFAGGDQDDDVAADDDTGSAGDDDSAEGSGSCDGVDYLLRAPRAATYLEIWTADTSSEVYTAPWEGEYTVTRVDESAALEGVEQGQAAFTEYYEPTVAGLGPITWVYSCDEEWIRLTETRDYYYLFIESQALLTPGVPWVPLQAVTGMTYYELDELEFVGNGAGWCMHVDIEVLGVDEEITVPAGTFRTLHLRRELNWCYCCGEFLDQEVWLHPEYGVVREELDWGPEMELSYLISRQLVSVEDDVPGSRSGSR